LRKVCSVGSAPLLFVIMVSLCTQAALAQMSDRVQAIESANMAPLAGTVHPLASAEFDRGLTDNSKVLSGMSINFKRSDDQEASLKTLLSAQQTPGSPSYHQWLTPAQFGQQFGMSATDIARVSDWLQSQGFTITAVSQSANSISFSGQVAAVEKAFQTEIHNYSVNGQVHYANSTQISVPAALSGTVSAVRGLDDFRPRPKVRFLHNSAARFTSGVSGAHYLAPGDTAVIYDVNPLYTAGFTGKGLTIVIVGQTDIVPADITNFRSAAGLSVNNPTVVTVPGTTPETVAQGSDGDLAETDLDLEWSGGVANAASIVLVNSNDVFTSLQYAIQNPIGGITVPIISMSYGLCEAQTTTSTITDTEGYLEQANGQGQTVMLAAGDSGAADCDDSTSQNIITSATQGLAVDYPGSSAYVTSVGGSEFMGDGTATSPQTGSGTYWSANGSNDVLTSAKSYIPEMAWNDTTFEIQNGGGLSAGGGGASKLFKKPTWQTGVPNIPADGFRDVPDISLDASPDHDSYIYCTSDTSAWVNGQQNSCNSGFRDSVTSDFTLAGGTSFAAPSFSGLVAIIEQKLASGPLGNINPSLYTMASNATTYTSAFHDITTGNNQVPCTNGTPNCATTGSNNVIGYVAGTGYDQATGIGSVDANNLATAYAALVKATGTTTALTASPGSSIVINEKVTFTATVTPNTLSTAPAGSVTFFVDGVAGTPVTIATASPFTATYQTDFPSAGSHTVSATYSSSDSTYTGSSSSSLLVTVAASGTAATTTTVAANPATVALGSSITLTATVTGTTAGTLTGPMTFTTGGVTIGKVPQVTIGSGNTATAALTVNATTSLGFAAGTDTITASYGGDTYNAASSGTTNVTVTNPSISVSATNVTISSPSPGNSGTSTITFTSTGGYAGTANITGSLGNLAANTTLSPQSVVLSAGGTATATLVITTAAATGNVQKGIGTAKLAAAGGTIAGCLLLLLVPGIRRKRWPAALIMLVFLSVGAGIGCGGGTGGASPGGTYTVTIVATDSSNTNITGSGTFTVTIN
jgi:Pro-kumamolisin, activation domain/Bacterial Ig-like domain (group 3)